MAQGQPSCPHVKAGLSSDTLVGMYKGKPMQPCKNDVYICLKCGCKDTKSMLSIHADSQHAHKIAICLNTMEAWCFRCRRVATGRILDNVISQLNELPYFRKRIASTATCTQPANRIRPTLSSKQVQSSPLVKTNASAKITQCVGQKVHMYVGQKSHRNALPVSRPSESNTLKQIMPFPYNGGSQSKPKRIQCQQLNNKHHRLTNICCVKKGNSKVITKQSKIQNPSSAPSKPKNPNVNDTAMEIDYITTSKPKSHHYPPKPITSGIGLNTTHNHLRVDSNTRKDVKEKNKPSKSNGHIKRDIQTEKRIKHDQTDKTRNIHRADGFVIHKSYVPVNVPEKSDTLIKSTPHHNKREIQQLLFSNANPKPKEHYHHPCNDEREKWNGSNDYDNKPQVFPTVPHDIMLPGYKPIVGLKNVGNTCFFNSALQIIYQSRYLQYHIGAAIKYPRKSELDGPEGLVEFKITKPPGQLTSALNRFLNETESPAQVRNPAFLLDTLATRYKRFRGFNQQDSHEAFRCLLDGLRMEEIKRQQEGVCSKLTGNPSIRAKYEKLARKSRTFVDETFGGVLSSTVICRECFTTTQLTEPFIDVSLSISTSRSRKHGNSEVENPHAICKFLQERNLHYQLQEYTENDNLNTLEACLRGYTTLEVLDDDNKFICRTCTSNKANNSLTTQSRSSLDGLALCPVSKLLLLHELPKILVLHLKRFKLGATVTKNNRHIDFPFELDVAPYCSDNCKNHVRNNKIMYSLYGVVVHHGSLHGGHYTAYVKAAGTHGTVMWYYASDSHVRSARVEEIEKSSAYMLFYESTMPLSSS